MKIDHLKQPPEHVAIVGHGIIGSSWALVFARAGMLVRVWARDEERRVRAKRAIEATMAPLAGTSLQGDSGTLERISFHQDIGDAVRGAIHVQESVPEHIDTKHETLAAIERTATPDCTIGSSTSGIMPSVLGAMLQNPERFVVVHPLTPPHLIPITEVCAGPQTSKDTIDRTMSMLRAVGQHPILLQAEIAGFALNRILGALLNECFFLIKDGVLRVSDVDALFTEGFGLRWSVIGPLAAMDLNAPGGIQDYLHRYGSIFRVVAKDRGALSALDASLIDRIALEFRQGCAGGERSERLERRDRAIAHVNVYRRTLDR